MKRLVVGAICGWLLLGGQVVLGQGDDARRKTVDILRYDFQIGISDSNDVIEGHAAIRAELLQPGKSIHLDLHAADGNPKGMVVSAVRADKKAVDFTHHGEDLEIAFGTELPAHSEVVLEVDYHGIPADGLIISASEKDGRSFFGDNWPNRAHHWLPVVDHPADKAPVGFQVTAPSHYQIVANGKLVEQKILPGGRQISSWDNPEPLPTKVMVIGAADFAIETVGEVAGVPVSTWVFRKDHVNGFHDYAQGKAILAWFVAQVGTYPWDKLANVQSRTRYGGMENASCIFYADGSVTGDGSCEALMAHEIAHQWFGNSASEANWYHIWLSEGFATYWTHLYFEQNHGEGEFKTRMAADRAVIQGWSPTFSLAVVDPRIKDLNQLLNANSYQKGGWVLHMLRRRIGDEAFFRGMKEYYARFKYGNALTEDLQQAMETASGQQLQSFFAQWIYRPGHPKLDVQWTYSKGKKCVNLQITQTQNSDAFSFPLELALLDAEGVGIKNVVIEVNSKKQKATIPIAVCPDQIKLDPNVNLLFEGKATKK